MWVRVSLTARQVATAKAGRHSDGRGLMLVVKPSGSKSWVLRYQLKGRRRDMGLGPYPEVTLARAREKTLEARRHIVDGSAPLSLRPTIMLTFRGAADELIESKRSGWRNAKHAAQRVSTLQTYVYPALGSLDVNTITTQHVLSVLKSIWKEKPETASRVRQRIEAVLDYAAAKGVRVGQNPARWRGHLENLLPKPSSVRAVEHHPALDWREISDFMKALAQRDGVSARTLEVTILTAARSGEVRGMRWREIDLALQVWTIPAERTKAKKEHRVPLTAHVIELLGQRSHDDALTFPSPTNAKQPLSDMTLTAVLRKVGRVEITVHGFRSTFRDWAGETTASPREVIESALAHRLKDKAEAAYARGDLFTKRRELMAAWESYALGAATTE
ncbi:MAG: integrase arm-type DNA-binding domain-containing protein [Pseudomonadota bacterium]